MFDVGFLYESIVIVLLGWLTTYIQEESSYVRFSYDKAFVFKIFVIFC